MASLSRLIREPLLHFLLLGAGFFLLFYQVADPPERESPDRIVVTRADTDRLVAQWQRQWQRPPTAEELDGLIESFIREEILYREALALGLDKDDVIIRRRLGQKLEFLFKDLAEQVEPKDEELERYLQQNAERYAVAGRFSFDHIYFNRDKRGAAAEKDARETRAQLNVQTGSIDSLNLGDSFLYQYHFEKQSPAQISRIFGQKFADQLPGLENGEWRGPIESGYGVHLVYVRERIQPGKPSLDDVRDKVRWDVIAEKRREIDTAFYRELRQRYDVRLEQEDGQLQKVIVAADQ